MSNAPTLTDAQLDARIRRLDLELAPHRNWGECPMTGAEDCCDTLVIELRLLREIRELRSALSEERGVRETMEVRIRELEALDWKLIILTLDAALGRSLDGWKDGPDAKAYKAILDAIAAYFTRVVELRFGASLTAEPPALDSQYLAWRKRAEEAEFALELRGLRPLTVEEMQAVEEFRHAMRDEVIPANVAYARRQALARLGIKDQPLAEPPALESPSELTAPSEDEIRAAIRVLEWVKRDAVDAQNYAQAADLRGGQFRLERLLPALSSVEQPIPTEGEQTQEEK
jgi:hypothetical protein